MHIGMRWRVTIFTLDYPPAPPAPPPAPPPPATIALNQAGTVACWACHFPPLEPSLYIINETSPPLLLLLLLLLLLMLHYSAQPLNM